MDFSTMFNKFLGEGVFSKSKKRRFNFPKVKELSGSSPIKDFMVTLFSKLN